MPQVHDVAVVGAGPAGLAAAVQAAEAGLDVALIDAAGQPGGQYWRHFDEDHAVERDLRAGDERYDQLGLIGRELRPCFDGWCMGEGERRRALDGPAHGAKCLTADDQDPRGDETDIAVVFNVDDDGRRRDLALGRSRKRGPGVSQVEARRHCG